MAARNPRISAIIARIEDIQSVWADSDAQERAWFAQDIKDARAEIAAIEGAAEQANAKRNWRRFVKSVSAEIAADVYIPGGKDHDRRQAEFFRVVSRIDRAERRAFDRGFDVREQANAQRAAAGKARDAAADWFRVVCESRANPPRAERAESEVDRQWREDCARASF